MSKTDTDGVNASAGNPGAAGESGSALLQHSAEVRRRAVQLFEEAEAGWSGGGLAGVMLLVAFALVLGVCCMVAVLHPELLHPDAKEALPAAEPEGSRDTRPRSSLRLPTGAFAQSARCSPRPTMPTLPSLTPNSLAARGSQSSGQGCAYPWPSASPVAGSRPMRSARGSLEGAAKEDVYCPDLVVPPNCECVLLVQAATAPVEVKDPRGRVVLRAAVKSSTPTSSCGYAPAFSARSVKVGSAASLKSSPQAPAHRARRRLVLTGESGIVLAQGCCAGSPEEFYLLRPSGQQFAKLTAGYGNKDRYTLETNHGMRLRFWGSFGFHAINITDGGNQLLATTEPSTAGVDYRLRVAPSTDVGLVLCSLLCIEHLGEDAR